MRVLTQQYALTDHAYVLILVQEVLRAYAELHEDLPIERIIRSVPGVTGVTTNPDGRVYFDVDAYIKEDPS